MPRLITCATVLMVTAGSFHNAVAEECRFVEEVNGTAVAKSAAFERVRIAAFDGDNACQRLLGSMYGFGIGTQASEVAARRWRIVAALSGDAAGRLELVSTFGARDSVYDPVLVYALLAEGANQDESALRFWSAKLSAQELAEAKQIGTVLSHLRRK